MDAHTKTEREKKRMIFEDTGLKLKKEKRGKQRGMSEGERLGLHRGR